MSVPDEPHDLCSVEIGAIHPIFGLLFSPQQSCTAVVPGSALNPVGQAVHAVEAFVLENVSAGQFTHALAPGAAEYVPAGHALAVPVD